MRKIPLGNLNSNNPIKTSVKKYHASVARQSSLNMYSLGPYDGREVVILFNEKTRLTEEETIEYFI